MTSSINWESDPTPSLEEFAELEAQDRNLWWRIGCGHHENLFEAARDRVSSAMTEQDIRTLRAAVESLTAIINQWPDEVLAIIPRSTLITITAAAATRLHDAVNADNGED